MSTCPVHEPKAKSPPLFHDGTITFQAHHVGWIICGFFTTIATAVSWWLIDKHLSNYTNKRQQRYIVRLLFMVPIYSIITLTSYILYEHASPFVLVRDAYETVVLSAFFYLMLQYISPDSSEQKQYFRRTLTFGATWKWMFPIGWLRWKPEDSLYFLQIMKWGVLQYCILRPLTTLIAAILEGMNLYCEASWGLGWGHIYIVTIVSLSVTLAMYCLLQLYVVIAKDLTQHKPLLKFIAVKAVVFLTFWQTTFLGVLETFGVVKDQEYMTADEINVGFAALLQTFEMMLFAFLHIKAFSYLPYKRLPPVLHSQIPTTPTQKLPQPQITKLRALAHVFDFRDMYREVRDGCIYMYLRMRGVEAEGDRRQYHFESMMGRARPTARYNGGGGNFPPPPITSSLWDPRRGRGGGWEGAAREHDAAHEAQGSSQIPTSTGRLPSDGNDPQSESGYLWLDDAPPPSIIRAYSSFHHPSNSNLEFTARNTAFTSERVQDRGEPSRYGRSGGPAPPARLSLPAPLSPARFSQVAYIRAGLEDSI